MRIDQDVLAVLARCSTSHLFLFLPEQLDRKLYVRVNKVLEALGFAWQRKHKAHVIGQEAGSAADALEAVLLTGKVILPETFQFFPTPLSVVEQLAELADLAPGQEVLEPSSGDGAIAKYLATLGCAVRCIELQEAKAAITRAAGLPTMVQDFLTVTPAPIFDRVVMNPPFSKRQEAAHVLHALQFLKPGGRLVAVMSAGIQFRSDELYSQVRTLVKERKGSIEALPEGAFKSSGTDVNTCLVSIDAVGSDGLMPSRAYEKALENARLGALDRGAGVLETKPVKARAAAAPAVPPPAEDFALVPRQY